MKTKNTLQQLIDPWKFDYVNSDITKKNFSLEDRGLDEYKVFHFDKYLSSKEVIEEMEKEGYSPANAYELFTWKEWNGKVFVIALGSVAEVRGERAVLYLGRYGSLRKLNLGWFDGGWGGGCRFLAVRNPKFIPSESLSPDLKGRVESLESDMKTKKN